MEPRREDSNSFYLKGLWMTLTNIARISNLNKISHTLSLENISTLGHQLHTKSFIIKKQKKSPTRLSNIKIREKSIWLIQSIQSLEKETPNLLIQSTQSLDQQFVEAFRKWQMHQTLNIRFEEQQNL